MYYYAEYEKDLHALMRSVANPREDVSVIQCDNPGYPVAQMKYLLALYGVVTVHVHRMHSGGYVVTNRHFKSKVDYEQVKDSPS